MPTTKMLHLLLAMLLLALTACSKQEDGSPGQRGNPSPPISLEARKQEAGKVDPALISAHNRLGLQLHRELVGQAEAGDNVLLSPYSIWTALSMAYNGSAGTTASEMASVFGLKDMPLSEFNAGNRILARLLEGEDSGVRLNIANAIWHQQGVPFKDSFIQAGKDSYGAEVQEVDFASDKSTKTINRWISKETGGKIEKMLVQPLPKSTIAVLANAIYFNGAWTDPFNPKYTKEEPFMLADGSERTLPMMHTANMLPYKETPDWQAVRLPYGDGRMDMLVILPAAGSSLDQLEQQLWADPALWQQPFDEASVQLGLPRFKAEYGGDLKDPLIRLGMKQAFQPDGADFSHMADIRPLFLSKVLHRMVLDVNEKGTEAAAATVIGAESGSMPMKVHEMTVNRPFFLAIEDTQTRAWLFIGSVNDPE
ncbi:serpin family protein [Paenibacillus sp. XY044]|uniref:serpin family protein n=1 Tax=Paenibacillus sp. XY044 TaxID=2026089 RepID=UPI000B99CCCC|nr:serpin family protein [Paenibacillus sp. XY044]OZB90301.1 hypothetical protein CJP46_33730 [Paenibacillus sp. XY044]